MIDKHGAATALEGVANCLQPREVAVRLFGAAHALRQAIGAPILPVDQAEVEQWLKRMRVTLGAQNFETHWAEGVTLTYEQAITLALAQCL